MAILVDQNTKVLVQGITGRQGSFHTKLMLDYGTKILAGVTPGKAGQTVHGIPVFDSVFDALEKFPEINTSIVFVPANFATDAIFEAIEANIKLIVVITERIPMHDAVKFVNYAKIKGITIIGPNCPGIISPPYSKVGIMPAHIFKEGRIGIISRSGTLTYEVAYKMSKFNFGISTAVGIGGDAIIGTDFIEIYNMFLEDKYTDAVVLIGEIGGDLEERFANYYSKLNNKKPVVAFIAGKSAPEGKRMGHAGAIVSMGMGSAKEKIEAFVKAGIKVADKPDEIPKLLNEVLKR
jgi:succinyl-CoA synthetase (ADP-forming) alpha subunit (EC 6.2.1.5)